MGTQIDVKREVDSVRELLKRMEGELVAALPKHLTPERLMRVSVTALRQTPKLLECDRSSLFAAIFTAAQLGLEPDGVLGHAYLVPFKGKVQFIPGYKGYLLLARNSGEISTIQAHEVCEGDEFDYAYGFNERLDHKVVAETRTWDTVTHFYAYAIFKDGGRIFEVMTRAQVEKIRNGSSGYQAFKKGAIKENPWNPKDDITSIQMGRKSLIRRISNYLPLSVQRAAAIDAAYERGEYATTDKYGDVIPGELGDEPNTTASLPDSTTTGKLDALAANGNGADEASEGPTPGSIQSALMRAGTIEDIDEQLDLARSVEMTDEERSAIASAADKQREKFKAPIKVEQPETATPTPGGGLFGDDN